MLNKEIVERFYSAFSELDFPTLSSCLSENIIYHDPIFGLLEGEPVFYLWQMKCERLREFSFTFSNIEELDAEYTTCNWQISFFHRPTGDVVTMPGKAYMRIADGKIIEHSDGYKISEWLTVTQGWKGKLFGWTGYMKRKEENIYRKILERYIRNKNLFKDEIKRSHDYDFSDR